MNTHIRSFMLQAYLNRELDSETEAEFELELLRDPELDRKSTRLNSSHLDLSRMQSSA